jgi:ABC-type nitrate/sulfonate/bicarbonate transport system permease component
VGLAAQIGRHLRPWRYAALSLGLLLLAWQISSAYIPEYIFPGIPKVAAKALALLQDPSTYGTVLATLNRILGSFAISALFGIALGVAMAMSTRTYEMLMPALKFVMGIPALTWVLLCIIWFRSAELRVWFMMFVLVFPIVATNTYDGVRAIPHELYHMVKSLRPGRARMLRMLVVPAAMPFIFTGLRVALSFGGRIAVFAEALSASTGIGAAMYAMNQVFDSAGIIAWTFVLVAVLSLLDGALGFVEARWFRWRRSFQG